MNLINTGYELKTCRVIGVNPESNTVKIKVIDQFNHKTGKYDTVYTIGKEFQTYSETIDNVEIKMVTDEYKFYPNKSDKTKKSNVNAWSMFLPNFSIDYFTRPIFSLVALAPMVDGVRGTCYIISCFRENKEPITSLKFQTGRMQFTRRLFPTYRILIEIYTVQHDAGTKTLTYYDPILKTEVARFDSPIHYTNELDFMTDFRLDPIKEDLDDYAVSITAVFDTNATTYSRPTLQEKHYTDITYWTETAMNGTASYTGNICSGATANFTPSDADISYGVAEVDVPCKISPSYAAWEFITVKAYEPYIYNLVTSGGNSASPEGTYNLNRTYLLRNNPDPEYYSDFNTTIHIDGAGTISISFFQDWIAPPVPSPSETYFNVFSSICATIAGTDFHCYGSYGFKSIDGVNTKLDCSIYTKFPFKDHSLDTDLEAYIDSLLPDLTDWSGSDEHGTIRMVAKPYGLYGEDFGEDFTYDLTKDRI